jgi:UDP-glucose 4-epimerase
MNYIVTGCAGFIGSNLAQKLLNSGHSVLGIDNLTTGKKKFLKDCFLSDKFIFYKQDLTNTKLLNKINFKADAIFHFAANADVRFGYKNPTKDLEQNTIVTSNILEYMRTKNIKKIIFSSTGSVYGEAKIIPTKEDGFFPIQTSFYGASKLACEALIQAYCEAFNFKCYIFRFVSLLGERYSHGHVIDFYKKLKNNNKILHVLGNGNQKKSYLNVNDCIDAILLTFKKSKKKINILNLGTEEYISVKQSVKIICDKLKVNPKVVYQKNKRGWIGDNPFIYLNIKKIKEFGWKPKKNIKESIDETLNYIQKNQWLIKK